MKVFWVFSWYRYGGPSGSMSDLVGTFQTEREAWEYVAARETSETFWDVVDIKEYL